MKPVGLRALVLPPSVWAQVLKLLATIEGANYLQSVNFAAHHASGFVLGLETAGAFPPGDIEALYIGFDTAAELRREALRHA